MLHDLKKRLYFYNSFNPFIRSFMISDGLLYSAWSLIFPLFAVFVTNNITGGNIEVAASGVTTYFVVRAITEVATGKYLSHLSEKKRITILIFGMLLVSIAYFGFGFTNSVFLTYLFWSIAGIGWGLSTPTKLSLFSLHLDKKEAVTEWSVYDVINLVLVAVATALGGLIATKLGFQVLFFLAAVINLLGIIPFLYLKKTMQKVDLQTDF